MGILNNLFGSKNREKGQREQKAVPWIQLTFLDQLEEIEKKSITKPQIIFKHSITCGISRMVLRMFEENYDLPPHQADLYYLDIHGYRQVSDETGYKFQVLHESPQLLIIKNGTVAAHASHGGINEVRVEDFV